MGVAEGQEGGRAAPLTWALTWLSGSHLTAASSCARRFSSSDTCGVWGEGPGPQCGARSQVRCPPTGRPCGASSPPAHLGRLGKLVLLRPPVELEGDGIAGRGGGPGGALPRCRFAALGHLQLLQQPPGDRREGTRWAQGQGGHGGKGGTRKKAGDKVGTVPVPAPRGHCRAPPGSRPPLTWPGHPRGQQSQRRHRGPAPSPGGS